LASSRIWASLCSGVVGVMRRRSLPRDRLDTDAVVREEPVGRGLAGLGLADHRQDVGRRIEERQARLGQRHLGLRDLPLLQIALMRRGL
jgi:hypothetical protein